MTLSHVVQRVQRIQRVPSAGRAANAVGLARARRSGLGLRQPASAEAQAADSRPPRPACERGPTGEAGSRSVGVWNQAPENRRTSSADSAARSAAPRSTPSQAPSPSVLIRPAGGSGGTSHTSALLRPFLRLSAPVSRAFCSSATMVATKIDGTAIARKVRERLQAEIAQKKSVNPRFQPSLKIIQGAWARTRSASLSLVTNRQRRSG